jgi:hypothetical protein
MADDCWLFTYLKWCPLSWTAADQWGIATEPSRNPYQNHLLWVAVPGMLAQNVPAGVLMSECSLISTVNMFHHLKQDNPLNFCLVCESHNCRPTQPCPVWVLLNSLRWHNSLGHVGWTVPDQLVMNLLSLLKLLECILIPLTSSLGIPCVQWIWLILWSYQKLFCCLFIYYVPWPCACGLFRNCSHPLYYGNSHFIGMKYCLLYSAWDCTGIWYQRQKLRIARW